MDKELLKIMLTLEQIDAFNEMVFAPIPTYIPFPMTYYKEKGVKCFYCGTKNHIDKQNVYDFIKQE